MKNSLRTVTTVESHTEGMPTRVVTSGVDDAGPLFIDFSTRKLRAKYNDTLQVNASKELCTTFNCQII